MNNNVEQQISLKFKQRQGRQIMAIAVTIFTVILLAVAYKYPDFFGEYSNKTLFLAQLAIIIAFINFTAFNWRCPSCDKYLGADINKRACRRCRTIFIK